MWQACRLLLIMMLRALSTTRNHASTSHSPCSWTTTVVFLSSCSLSSQVLNDIWTNKTFKCKTWCKWSSTWKFSSNSSKTPASQGKSFISWWAQSARHQNVHPPELEEADPGFQDCPHLIFDSADIDGTPSNAFAYSDAFTYPISSRFRNWWKVCSSCRISPVY